MSYKNKEVPAVEAGTSLAPFMTEKGVLEALEREAINGLTARAVIQALQDSNGHGVVVEFDMTR